jgi:hypothetical protein
VAALLFYCADGMQQFSLFSLITIYIFVTFWEIPLFYVLAPIFYHRPLIIVVLNFKLKY